MSNAPKMTKAHFEFIASIIKRTDDGATWTAEEIATHFADWLKETNPNFNRDTFLRACQYIHQFEADRLR